MTDLSSKHDAHKDKPNGSVICAFKRLDVQEESLRNNHNVSTAHTSRNVTQYQIFTLEHI